MKREEYDISIYGGKPNEKTFTNQETYDYYRRNLRKDKTNVNGYDNPSYDNLNTDLNKR